MTKDQDQRAWAPPPPPHHCIVCGNVRSVRIINGLPRALLCKGKFDGFLVMDEETCDEWKPPK